MQFMQSHLPLELYVSKKVEIL